MIDNILNTDLFKQKGVGEERIRKLVLKYSKNPPAETAALEASVRQPQHPCGSASRFA